MPTQANQPLGDGYPLQNCRVRKVLSCGGFSGIHLAGYDSGAPLS